jgi:hypothetical protein
VENVNEKLFTVKNSYNIKYPNDTQNTENKKNVNVTTLPKFYTDDDNSSSTKSLEGIFREMLKRGDQAEIQSLQSRTITYDNTAALKDLLNMPFCKKTDRGWNEFFNFAAEDIHKITTDLSATEVFVLLNLVLYLPAKHYNRTDLYNPDILQICTTHHLNTYVDVCHQCS